MFSKLLSLALALTLTATLAACSGCSSMSGVDSTGAPAPLTQEQKIDLVCTGVTASVKAVTYADAAGKIDKLGDPAKVRKDFLAATEITDPICGVKPYPTLDSAKMVAFEKAAEVLRGVVSKL